MRAEHLRAANIDRQRKAVADARMVAEHADVIVQALIAEDPKLEAVGIALKELVGFVQDIRGDYSAITGHAREHQAEATDHASDLANAATIAMNIDRVVVETPYHIGADTDTGDVQRILEDISRQVWQRRQSSAAPFRVGLVIREADDVA